MALAAREVASHEIAEAATNPIFDPNEAWSSRGDAWDLFGGEVGDRCQDDFMASPPRVTEGGFVFQRSYSNKAAKAGHDPCVPAPASPYFNVKPRDGNNYEMTVGQSLTIPVSAISDAPLSAFKVTAKEATNTFGLGDNVLDVSLSADHLTPGQAGTLTVKLKSRPRRCALVVLESTATTADGTVLHEWPILLSVKK